MSSTTKKISWVLYDALNSLVIIAGAVYFTKWLIADAGISDTVVAVTVSLASLIFIVIGPRFGAALRSERNVWRALLITTLLVGVLSTFLGVPGLSGTGGKTIIYGSIIAFLILNVVYQLSLVAYNSYLPRITTHKSLQKYSGLGEASGQLGSVVGIFIAISLLSLSWFKEESVRIFLVLGPAVLILSLISVFLLRKKTNNSSQKSIVNDQDFQKRPISQLLKTQHFPSLILVVFLYNNAFAALQIFSGSYLAIAANWDEKAIGLGIAGTLIGAALGGLSVGLLKKRVTLGSLLVIGLTVFAVSITGLAFLGSKTQILLSLIGGGIGFGLLAATSRVCIVILAKDFSQGEKFGVYAAVSRSSAVIGPLLWAGALVITSGSGEIISRQVGMGVLSAMIWIGLLLTLLTNLKQLHLPDLEE